MKTYTVNAVLPFRFDVPAESEEGAIEYVEDILRKTTPYDILGHVDGEMEIGTVEEQ